MEETLRADLLELLRRHTAASSLAPGAIGKAALRDHTFFPRLEAGDAGFNVRTFDKLVRWFSDNWPARAAWPANVERPNRAEAPAPAHCA